jgi:hypothetical protein
MLLQKLIHSQDDVITDDGQNVVITHGVSEVTCGGEYTICGRAIPDSSLIYDGFEAVGESYRGSINKCECKYCLEIIRYFKSLR